MAAPAEKAETGAPDLPAASQAAEEKAAKRSWSVMAQHAALSCGISVHALARSDLGDSACAICLTNSYCMYPSDLSRPCTSGFLPAAVIY